MYLLCDHFIQEGAMSPSAELTGEPLDAEPTGKDILSNLSCLVGLVSDQGAETISLKSPPSGSRDRDDWNWDEEEEEGEEEQEWKEQREEEGLEQFQQSQEPKSSKTLQSLQSQKTRKTPEPSPTESTIIIILITWKRDNSSVLGSKCNPKAFISKQNA